ncbi:MAG: tetratricopeptide repeat protein [Acidobacteria bacterium]|nr:tetratricopeptide repeat protein [Acidobacteriota bacterium]
MSLWRVGCVALLLCSGISLFAQANSPEVARLLREAQAALAAEDFPRAIQNFTQARQLAPANLEAARGLLLSNLQAGHPAEVIAAGREAATRWPEDPQLLHWLGLAYFKQGQLDPALAALQRSAKNDAAGFDIHFDIALVLLSKPQYPAAAEELETALRYSPQQALAHVLLGRAYLNSNRTLQAIEQFQTALRLQPETPLVHYHLGFAYASLGRNSEAIAEYEKELARAERNAELRYQLGRCLLETGDWKAAIPHLQAAVQLDPRNGDAAYNLGKALLQGGEIEAAIVQLQNAGRLRPEDPSPHYQLARALEKAGRKVEAGEEMRRFSELKKAQPQTGGMATGRVQ